MRAFFHRTAQVRSLDAVWEGVLQARARHGATACGLYVLRGGRLAGEYYAGRSRGNPAALPVGPASRFNVYSIRKTYIGFAVAWAVIHGFIEVDDRLADYVDSVPAHLLAGTAIRHVLTHTHGLDGAPGRMFRRFAPGESWHYTNTGVSLLCEAVLAATGETVGALVRRLILEPLLFGESGWEGSASRMLVSDSGIRKRELPFVLDDDAGAGRNLYVSARELARWGGLHLAGGRAGRRDGVEQAAFALATADQTPDTLPKRLPRHGFFWWLQTGGGERSEIGARVPKGAFQIVGMSGCVCLVVPALDLVAVRMYNGVEANRLTFVRDVKNFGNTIVEWAIHTK